MFVRYSFRSLVAEATTATVTTTGDDDGSGTSGGGGKTTTTTRTTTTTDYDASPFFRALKSIFANRLLFASRSRHRQRRSSLNVEKRNMPPLHSPPTPPAALKKRQI